MEETFEGVSFGMKQILKQKDFKIKQLEEEVCFILFVKEKKKTVFQFWFYFSFENHN